MKQPPHITEPYEKPDGEPDGFCLPDPEPSKQNKSKPREAKEEEDGEHA